MNLTDNNQGEWNYVVQKPYDQKYGPGSDSSGQGKSENVNDCLQSRCRNADSKKYDGQGQEFFNRQFDEKE